MDDLPDSIERNAMLYRQRLDTNTTRVHGTDTPNGRSCELGRVVRLAARTMALGRGVTHVVGVRPKE